MRDSQAADAQGPSPAAVTSSTRDRIPSSRFTTASLAPEVRFDAWRESIDVIFETVLDDNRAPPIFDAAITSYLLDTLMLSRCVSRVQNFSRSPLKVAADGLDHYMLQIYRRGTASTRLGRRDVLARPGDVFVIDLAASYDAVHPDYENFTLVVPRALIADQLERPDSQHCRVIPAAAPLARLFREMVSTVYETAEETTLDDGVRMVSPLLRLTEALLNSDIGGHPQDVDMNAIEHAGLVRAKRHVEIHLKDPQLSPVTLAEALGISRSRLYRMFEPLGGVASYIRGRRLRRSARDLLEPGRADRRIKQVAFEWGFERESDYTRAFRRLFGITPSEARQIGTLHGEAPGAPEGPCGDRRYEQWLRMLVG